MYDSVRVFATEIIDYAGLFPPAQLGMAKAFERFERHSAVTSFGSCSFAEPRDELRHMGLLDAIS